MVYIAATFLLLARISGRDLRAFEVLPGREPTLGRFPRSTVPAKLISQNMFIGLFCESQFPHKFVNVSFIIAYIKNKLTDFCEN